DLDIPAAPPISRPAALPVRRPRAPAVALLVLGAALVIGPVVGGLFSKAASGRQLLDAFRPHLQADALDRYEQDLRTLRAGSAAVDAVYGQEHVQPGRFPGVDAYRQQSADINDRASTLLDQVEAAEPSFREVDSIGGFERVPFLVVAAGITALYGGGVLLVGSNRGARAAAPLVALAAAALVAYPFLSNLPGGSRAGHRMVVSLAPVMTEGQVAQLQQDFVVLVTAEGQLDTAFRSVPKQRAAATALARLGNDWPTISSDLATLVGTINDNIPNYGALRDLDRITSPVGVSGLAALPWALVVVGATGAGLATAARPRRRKEQA
ncbi:MAG: hypothetical protein JWM40_1298, partial [Frankiales bacterium]|nr:hypothetical protein [Frankiales bacterium]